MLVSMVPEVTLSYMVWWMRVQPMDLGKDEEEDSDGQATSEGSSNDDPYQVNNLMHDILMHGKEGTQLVAPGMRMLADTVPLVVGGKI